MRGSAFEFHRNDALDARNYFDVGDKPDFTRNQFGGDHRRADSQRPAVLLRRLRGAAREPRQHDHLERARRQRAPRPAAGPRRPGRLPQRRREPGRRAVPERVPAANGDNLGGGLALYTLPLRPDAGPGLPAGPRRLQPRARRTSSSRATPSTMPTSGCRPTIRSSRARSCRATSSSRASTARRSAERVQHAPLRLQPHARRPERRGEHGRCPPFVPGRELVGDIDIGGMQRFGPQTSADLRFAQNVFSGQYDAAWTRGRHLFKAGALVERYLQDMVNPTFSLGIYPFANLRAFLENRPTQLRRPDAGGAHRSVLAVHAIAGLYAQDDFQVHAARHAERRAALRVDDDADGHRRPRLGARQPDRHRGHRRPAVREPRRTTNLSPRVGAAWDVLGDGRTSVRGGYGLYFNTNNQQNLIVTVTNPPATPRVVIANPTFPDAAVRPRRRQLDPPGAVGPRDAAPAHVERERAARAAGAALALTVGYAGSRGHAPAAQQRRQHGRAARRWPTARRSSPPARRGRTRPYSTIELKSSDGDSWYNALILEVRRRWQNGLSVQSSYTWSRRPRTRRRRRRSSRTRPTARRRRSRSSSPTTTRGRRTSRRAQLGAERDVGRAVRGGDLTGVQGALLDGWQRLGHRARCAAASR